MARLTAWRLLVVRVGFTFTTVVEPVEFSQLSPFGLGLQFVPRHLLLLLGLSDTQLLEIIRHILISTVGGTAGSCRRSGRSSRGSILGNSASGSAGFRSSSGSGSRRVVKGVFDDGDFTTVGKFSVIDVPDLGAECGNEFLRMRNNANGSSPFLDGDGETTRWSALIQFVQNKRLTPGLLGPRNW